MRKTNRRGCGTVCPHTLTVIQNIVIAVISFVPLLLAYPFRKK